MLRLNVERGIMMIIDEEGCLKNEDDEVTRLEKRLRRIVIDKRIIKAAIMICLFSLVLALFMFIVDFSIIIIFFAIYFLFWEYMDKNKAELRCRGKLNLLKN